MSQNPSHSAKDGNIDYRETADVTEVHAAIEREHHEPSAETTPIPMWLATLCGGVLTFAGVYLGMFHGGFSGSIFNEYSSSPMALFAPVGGTGKDAAKKAPPTMAEMGKKVFELNCAACHAPTGGGGACPTLIGSDWVLGNEKRLIAMVLKGIQGQMTVKPGVVTTAAMVMPAQEAALDDKKAAQALTYIRQAWGNQAGEITPEMVASVRAEFKLKTSAWTEAEINQAIPAGATISATASPANGSAGSVPATPEKFDLAKSAERGKANYGLVCGACHQPTGLGMAPAFPPLAASDYVTGDPHRLVAIIIKGVQGEITVNGVKYNGMMPATETINPLMKDDSKLADVANYVRNAFGNKSEEPVTPEMVKAMRKKLETRTTGWTESELLNFPKEK